MKKNTSDDVWLFVKRGAENECWIWSGSTFSGRYGRFHFNGGSHLSHKFIFELMVNKVPDGLFVMHKCNNKLCCNPNHLTVGTNSQNQRHASMSGAFKVGEVGIRGIGFDKARNYWKAIGYLNGKLFNLYTGPFQDKAIEARCKWEQEHGITFNIQGASK